ncbi:MAG: hypothetical protein K0R67_2280 [Paenibacillus sp.]|nr:hypothetical protein [Paenibacillus sp.]
MKKWTVMVSTVISLMVIAGCGNSTDTVKEENTGNIANTGNTGATPSKVDKGEPKENVPTVEELIKKTIEASQSLKSYSMDIQMDQNMSTEANGNLQEQKINMTIKTDMIKEPLTMYQEIKMNIPGMPQAQETKQYITQEGLFTQAQGKWIKLPDEANNQLLSSLNGQGSPEKQLEHFNTISKDTKVSEEGNNYVLKATVSGDSVKELAKQLMNSSGSANPELETMMGQMNITHLKLTYVIQKKEYLPVRMNVEMIMDMKQDTNKIAMDMKMDSAFSKYNEIKEIKVPQEVLDSAK